MSIITAPLADCIFIGSKGYRIKTDFRIWLEFERIMQDNSLSPSVKTAMIYDLCFEEPPPYGAALDAIMEFYLKDKAEGKGSGKRLLSFEKDGDYIYAAFYAQYGIDLTQEDMHWHKFRALFAGLSDEHMIIKIMQIRDMDISKIKDPAQKAHYRKLKRLYRIDSPKTDGLEAVF